MIESKFPESSQAKVLAGRILFELGDAQQARDSFTRALELSNETPECDFGMGTALQRLGKIEEAAKYYESAIRKRQNYFDALRNLAILHLNQRRYPEGSQWFLKALAVDPTDADCYFHAGLCFLMSGQAAEARRYWNHGQRQVPADVRLVEAVALAELQLGNLNGAANATQQVRQRKGDEATALFLEAILLRQAGEHSAAQEKCAAARQSSKSVPSRSPVRQLLSSTATKLFGPAPRSTKP